MKHLLLLALIYVIQPFQSKSQERYQHPVTDEIETETLTYASKDGNNLDLDIYRPAYDSDYNRATVVYVHGGGFQTGTRDSEDVAEFCSRLARYGYVVASISYRLTRKDQPGGFGCDCPAEAKINTFNAAVEDVQDATFFLIQNRESLGIDPQKIILAGSSAGAETVLNTAYQPPYCYGLDSGPVSYAGVISFAGAIPDTVSLYNESAVPSLLFHGTDDNLVPYGTAPHHYCSPDKKGYLVLHGSYTIASKLDDLGVPYWLHTTCGAGHEIAGSPMKDNFDEIVEFCYNYVLTQNGEVKHTIVEGIIQSDNYPQYDFCN